MLSFVKKVFSWVKRSISKIYRERIAIILLALLAVFMAENNTYQIDQCQRSETRFFLFGYKTSVWTDVNCKTEILEMNHKMQLAIMDKKHSSEIVKMTAKHSLDGHSVVEEAAIILYATMKDKKLREAITKIALEYREDADEEHNNSIQPTAKASAD